MWPFSKKKPAPDPVLNLTIARTSGQFLQADPELLRAIAHLTLREVFPPSMSRYASVEVMREEAYRVGFGAWAVRVRLFGYHDTVYVPDVPCARAEEPSRSATALVVSMLTVGARIQQAMVDLYVYNEEAVDKQLAAAGVAVPAHGD